MRDRPRTRCSRSWCEIPLTPDEAKAFQECFDICEHCRLEQIDRTLEQPGHCENEHVFWHVVPCHFTKPHGLGTHVSRCKGGKPGPSLQAVSLWKASS